MQTIDPFNWQGTLSLDNLAAVASGLRQRLQDRVFLLTFHSSFIAPDHHQAYYSLQLRGEDPITQTVSDGDQAFGLVRIFDTSPTGGWSVRTDSHTQLAFHERGITLRHDIGEGHCATLTFLTEICRFPLTKSNFLDLSTCSLAQLNLVASLLHFEESQAQAPEVEADLAAWREKRWRQFQGNMDVALYEMQRRQTGQGFLPGACLLSLAIFSLRSLECLWEQIMEEFIQQYGVAADPTNREHCQLFAQSLERLYQSSLQAELIRRSTGTGRSTNEQSILP